MSVIILLTYVVSLILAILTIFGSLCVAYIRPTIIRKLPKALRLFATVCYLPTVIIVAMSTVYVSTVFLMYGNEISPALLLTNRFNPYFIQTQQTFFLVLVLERIAATVYIEKYKLSKQIWFPWILISFTVIISVSFIYVVLNVINPANIPVVYTYTIFLLDLISLSVITVLYYLNRKIYKITAYRISLQKRCQIAENVKILTALFPLILVYTIIVPMGSVIKLLLIAFQLPSFPFSIQFVFLNLPHLIIFTHLIFVDLKRRKNVGDAKDEIVIQNVLGKNLSSAVTSEAYFKELKQMWN